MDTLFRLRTLKNKKKYTPRFFLLCLRVSRIQNTHTHSKKELPSFLCNQVMKVIKSHTTMGQWANLLDRAAVVNTAPHRPVEQAELAAPQEVPPNCCVIHLLSTASQYKLGGCIGNAKVPNASNVTMATGSGLRASAQFEILAHCRVGSHESRWHLSIDLSIESSRHSRVKEIRYTMVNFRNAEYAVLT